MLTKSERVKLWRKETKKRIIESFGSKCGICGYSKCMTALEAHHLNSKEKDFGISEITANPIAWKKTCKELKKCVLLCANCHREFHDGLINIPDNITKFNEKYIEYKKKEKEKLYDACPICGKNKKIYNITCSKICASKKKSKIKWETIDILDLIDNQKISFVKLASILNCSDMAVRKRYKKIKKGITY